MHALGVGAEAIEVAVLELDARAIGASATKRTSTVVTSEGSYFHSALICHVTTTRSGGSQAAT